MLSVAIIVSEIDQNGSQTLVHIARDLDENAPFAGMMEACVDAHGILKDDEHIEEESG